MPRRDVRPDDGARDPNILGGADGARDPLTLAGRGDLEGDGVADSSIDVEGVTVAVTEGVTDALIDADGETDGVTYGSNHSQEGV